MRTTTPYLAGRSSSPQLQVGGVVVLTEEPHFITDYFWTVSEPAGVEEDFSAWLTEAKKEQSPELPRSEVIKGLPSGVDPLANTLEKNARERFVNADTAYFAESARHIDINEGDTAEGNARRSCQRQAELWMRRNVLEIPGAAKASFPGCSLHNYGLAVDVKGINPMMRKCLNDEGWIDDYAHEAWHFSCLKSSAYPDVQKKIIELRNKEAGQWALDSARAYRLNKERNSLYTELTTRKTKFEGEVEAFNREAKRFNETKIAFTQQTEPHAARRDDLLARMQRLDALTLHVERTYAEFRTATDEILVTLEANLTELRRLLALSVESAEQELTPRLAEVPAALRQRYVELRDRFALLTKQHAAENKTFRQALADLQRGSTQFEQKAIELLKEHAFLTELRKKLEDEKRALERGFTDLPLMSRECGFLMVRAHSLLEKIQKQVDEISAL